MYQYSGLGGGDTSWRAQKHLEVVDANANYYDMLQVNMDASNDDLKRSFYQCGKKFNPDDNPGDQICATRFERVGKAFQILSDPKLRQMYDQNGINSDFENSCQFEDSRGLYNAMFGSSRLADLMGQIVPAQSSTVQVQGISKVVQTLIKFLSAYEEANRERFCEMMLAKAEWWCESTYGDVMLLDIAKIYEREAQQYMGFIDAFKARIKILSAAKHNKAHLVSCKHLWGANSITYREWQQNLKVIDSVIEGACYEAFNTYDDRTIWRQQTYNRTWAKGLLHVSQILNNFAINRITQKT